MVVIGAPSVRTEQPPTLEGEGGGPGDLVIEGATVAADLLAGVFPADSSAGLPWYRRLWAARRTRGTAASLPPGA